MSKPADMIACARDIKRDLEQQGMVAEPQDDETLVANVASVARTQSKSEGDRGQQIDSELEWARRLVRKHGKTLRHVWAWSLWFVWNGKQWDSSAQDEVRRIVKTSAREHTIAALDLNDIDALRRARKAESARGLESTLRLAASEPLVATSQEEFDCDDYAFNVLNGTIDLRTGLLRGHQSRDLITKLVEVEFDPGATCPVWDNFLQDILPSAAVREFLQRYLGYCLTGDVGEQVLAFFYGSGANGKSTFLATMQHLFGCYSCQAPDSLLLARKHAAHPTEITVLDGRRLAVCSEIEHGWRLHEPRVKQLTGGDRITARRMREDFWEFDPTHKIIIAANHKPRIRGTDEAIWRRILLVPFEITIPRDKRDPKLLERLQRESSGILAWLVGGCLAWQEQGLAPPEAVLAASARYRNEEDIVAKFLGERCSIVEGHSIAKRELYLQYELWANESGEATLSKRGFGARLIEQGFGDRRLGKENVWCWNGIRLKESE